MSLTVGEELTFGEQRRFDFRVACIGVGGQGWLNLRTVARHATVAAVCDVDRVALKRAKQEFPQALSVERARELFASQCVFEGVVISTPDHSHIYMLRLALSANKHVYCEKPLVSNLSDIEVVKTLLLNRSVSTYLGCQAICRARFQDLEEWVKARFQKESVEVTVWTDRPLQHFEPTPERLAISAHSLEAINWDEWLGTSSISATLDLHPVRWRNHPAFGTGALGDMGSHLLALPYLALELETLIDAREMPELAPLGGRAAVLNVRRSNKKDAVIVWLEGGPPTDRFMGVRLPENGCLIRTQSEGVLVMEWDASNTFYFTEGNITRLELPRKTRSHENQFEHWISSITKGAPTRADFTSFGVPLTGLILSARKNLGWDRR